jgi:anion-transporting  ArsA/GET3 family ATPase
MRDLFRRSLLVVTGKGGVGKSTVAAALGLAASASGLRTIVVEVAARDDVLRTLGVAHAEAQRERAVSERLHHISIDPQRTLEEYLRQQLPVGALAGLLSRSRVFGAFTAATPGMSELLTMGKVWELARDGRHRRGGERFDLVVLDAPATAQGLAMLQAPRTFASVARVGPVAAQGRAIAGFLGDSRETAVLAVAIAEEMPVSETLELRSRLREELGMALAAVIANAVVPHRFSARDERTLRAAAWADQQRAQLTRLRAGLGNVPLLTFPFEFRGALDRAALQALSRELYA